MYTYKQFIIFLQGVNTAYSSCSLFY